MIRAILADIEGTTTPLSFVRDVLFPYARQRMANFVQERGKDPVVAKLLQEAQVAAATELDEGELIAQLIAWIDEDRKITPLKALQGLIWEDGYRRGDFTAQVYEDTVRQLQAWQQLGLDLYVYSSGSVHAQKLLFAHTDHGDLTSLFSGYFDTTIGHKREEGSYRTIAAAIGLPPEEVMFLSDSAAELDAARQAGMHTIQVVRDGEPDSAAVHQQVKDFDAIRV